MGYRSQVAVVIYGDGRNSEKYALLKTLMNTTFKDAYTEFESNAEWHDNNHVLEFEMEDVKWYDGYGDVQKFMNMLDEIGDIEGFNYEFIRLGEDTNDVDEQYGGNDCEHILRVSRSIEVDL
jgi:arabinogalactan endo-1,4-beta-galactosidase